MTNFFPVHKQCFAVLLDMNNEYRKQDTKRLLCGLFHWSDNSYFYLYSQFLIHNNFMRNSQYLSSFHEITHACLTAKGRECLTHVDCDITCPWKYDCLFDRTLGKRNV